MNNLKEKKSHLKAQISELEESLTKLRNQLEHIKEEEQHIMIDHLEDHMDVVHTKSVNLKLFWQTMKEEITELMKHKS